MRVDSQSQGFSLTAPLLDHTQRRLRFTLTRSGDRIRRAKVRLGDMNGPRGGEDKVCKIQVYLTHAPPVLRGGRRRSVRGDRPGAAEHTGRNVTRHLERLLMTHPPLLERVAVLRRSE